MIVNNNIEELRLQIAQWRKNNESIAFVPTMGNLHDGHLSLVDIAQQQAARVVVSIYVNPLQFAPDEDYESYPRALATDIDKLTKLGVDLIFTPDDSMIYPQGEQKSTSVEVPMLSGIIEGKFRPGFFKGVATVVLKLFNLVQPDIAVFGEKDFQQLLIIRRMVEDFCLPIKIIGGETKRESSGLAMSSRNDYLTVAERDEGGKLSETLSIFRQQIEQGKSIKQVEESCTEILVNQGFIVDYMTIRETSCLNEVSDDEVIKNKELIILAVAKIGEIRLIDNLKFTV